MPVGSVLSRMVIPALLYINFFLPQLTNGVPSFELPIWDARFAT